MLLGIDQALDRARHAGGQVADDAELRDDIALCILIHRLAGLGGSLLAKVEKVGLTVVQANEHEAAAAEITRGRMHDRERESGCHGRVDRIASRAHHLDTGLGRETVDARDHAMLGVRRVQAAACDRGAHQHAVNDDQNDDAESTVHAEPRRSGGVRAV